MIKDFENIIWDWNGTLLDDMDISIESMNVVMRKRNLSLLTKEIYLREFTFPVKNYYAAIGFDFTKEPFEKPAIEFVENYDKYLPNCGLFKQVKPILASIKKQGKRQFILSAMEQSSLIKSVAYFQLEKYFIEVAGIENYYAKSKVQRGKKLFTKHKINKDNTLLIGDTLHDKEVADELGISCILLASGHQSKNRLSVNGNVVVNSLSDLLV